MNRLMVVFTSVIPAEAKRRAGIQRLFWMPDQVRHDDTIMRRFITRSTLHACMGKVKRGRLRQGSGAVVPGIGSAGAFAGYHAGADRTFRCADIPEEGALVRLHLPLKNLAT